MKSNVRTFYEQHLTHYENNRAAIPHIPANFAGLQYPPHMRAGGYAHPNAGDEDVTQFGAAVYTVWAGYLIKYGVRGSPIALECDEEAYGDQQANILVSKLTEKTQCNYCFQFGHYRRNVCDKTGDVIYCAKWLIDNGFPKDDGYSSFNKPIRTFARSTKRFTTTMQKGAKALLLTAAHMVPDKALPPEITAAIEEVDKVSDGDSDDSNSGMEEVAEKISDQQRGSRSGKHSSKYTGYRGKSPAPRNRRF